MREFLTRLGYDLERLWAWVRPGHRPLLLLVACLGLACHRPAPKPVPVPVPTPTPTPVPDPAPQPPDLATQLLDAHNRERAKRGLKAYVWNPKLQEAAQKHSDYQAKIGRMGHMGIGDGTPWSRIEAAGYAYSSAGENVAWNQTDVQMVLSDWMNSPGHRAAILNREYTEYGGAVASGSDGSKYWTSCFGSPGRPSFAARPESAEALVPVESKGGQLIPAWTSER